MAKNETTELKTDDLIDQRLLQARRIFLSEDVSFESANDIIRKLWYLEFSEPGKPILFVINSPGGVVDAGFAIWDQVQLITSPVTTLVTGLAASMGSVLSLCAPKGKRFATPYARIMIHQPRLSGVMQGQASDLEINAQEILNSRETLVQLYMDATGKSHEEIEKAIDRDRWFSAKDALSFGLINKIVTSFKDLP